MFVVLLTALNGFVVLPTKSGIVKSNPPSNIATLTVGLVAGTKSQASSASMSLSVDCFKCQHWVNSTSFGI